jgi:hypothetical protein
MCDGILIAFPGHKPFCIPIYRQIFTWPPHDPGPLHDIFQDVSTIATISQAVAHVENEGVRKQLGHAVQTALKAVAQKLPEGVTIGDQLMAGAERQ